MVQKNEYEYGSVFVEKLMDGTIYKEYMPNHGIDFTGGNEEYCYDLFESYMGSLGCYLMDKRLETNRREYHG